MLWAVGSALEMLVQIFIADFFSFVESEFSAVFGVAMDVLLLITIRFMIHREQERAHGDPAPPPGASPGPLPEPAQAG